MQQVSVFDYANAIVQAIPKGVLLTTKDTKVDSMVIGWGTLGVEWGKPMFVAYVRESRYTHAQLESTGEFTVNIPHGEADPKILKVCGTRSGRDVDKVKEAGLVLVEGQKVGVPGIRQFPLTLECKVVCKNVQAFESIDPKFRKNYPDGGDLHTAYYGEIVNAYIAD